MPQLRYLLAPRITLSFIIFIFALPSFAQKLVVNIDNPSFRKTITAVPEFVPSSKADREVEDLCKEGTAELRRLLSFSGLFNIVSDGVYKDHVKKLSEKDYLASDMTGIDLVAWRLYSVESLTLAHLTKADGEFTLRIRTSDTSQGKILIGKRYSKIKRKDFTRVIRRYADLILKAYTGKSGIFASKLVFIGRKDAKSEKQVYVSDFDGSNAVPITKERAPHLSPSWSRDGKSIVYTSFEDGNPDLFTYDLQSGKKRKISGKKGVNSGGQWSPNQKIIVFSGSTRNGESDLFWTTPDGQERKVLISGDGLDVDPTFSPDGKMIAYASGRFKNPHLFVSAIEWISDTQFKVKKETRLTFAGWYNVSPAWTPESDRIAFAGYDKEIDRWDIFMVNPDGSHLDRLTLKLGDNEHPSFSPNGQNIIFESNRTDGRDVKGTRLLHIMNRDGSSQRQLITGVHEIQQPNWGPQAEE